MNLLAANAETIDVLFLGLGALGTGFALWALRDVRRDRAVAAENEYLRSLVHTPEGAWREAPMNETHQITANERVQHETLRVIKHLVFMVLAILSLRIADREVVRLLLRYGCMIVIALMMTATMLTRLARWRTYKVWREASQRAEKCKCVPCDRAIGEAGKEPPP